MANRKRVRSTIELHFSDEEEREAFQHRFGAVRQLLSPPGAAAKVGNTTLLNKLFDSVEKIPFRPC